MKIYKIADTGMKIYKIADYDGSIAEQEEQYGTPNDIVDPEPDEPVDYTTPHDKVSATDAMNLFLKILNRFPPSSG